MNATQVEFGSLPWVTIAPGAREKRAFRGCIVVRLLEFSPPFVEHEWCLKPHTGYVVDGGFSIQFRDHTVSLVAGDGVVLPGGDTNAHKAIVDRTVLLFLIESIPNRQMTITNAETLPVAH
jgi:hypothetical protein